MAHRVDLNSTPPPTPNVIPVEILRDLVCKFTANIPEEERSDLIRVCFQIELAHWLFIDHYCKPGDKYHHLAHVPFNLFASLMFQMTPYLRKYSQQNLDQILNDFKEYKWKVPTYGAILMDSSMSQVLLVQGFGNTWGFPKGKVNKDEESVICAIREVKEETGYDITKLVNANHFIESNANDKNARLYLVVGVDTKFPFKPQTAYEIRQIGWFAINDLPENKNDATNIITRGYRVNQFYSVYSFMRRLKRWIADKKSGANQINCFRYPNTSMRFPYTNDSRTVWEADSPMTTGGAMAAAVVTEPRASRNIMEELTTSADLNQRWAQKFQRVHNNNPPILNATTPIQTKSAPQKQPIVSIASLIDSSLKEKQQNVRRRLFVEEEEANISTSISRMKPTDKDTGCQFTKD